MAALRIDVICEVRKLDALADAWGDLATRASTDDYTQAYDWCYLCWQIYHAPHARRLAVITVWAAEKLVAIWPFVARRVLGVNALLPLGCGHGDAARVLIDPEFDTTELADKLVQTLSLQADVAEHPVMPEGTRVLSALLRAGVTSSSRFECFFAVHTRNTDTWERFVSNYSANMRRALRTDRRKLDAMGPLLFEAVEDAQAQAQVIDWTFKQKRAWLLRHGLRELWFEGDRSLRFLKVLTGMWDTGRGLRVFVLKMNGQIIASRLCTATPLAMAGLVMTFDPTFGRYSPGMLITEDVLRWAFERGLNFNMGTAPNELKTRWATDRYTCQSHSVSFTFKGGLLRTILALKAGIGDVVKRRRSQSALQA